MTDEPRRARAAWALEDATGKCVQQGESEANVDDEGLGVGTARVAFVDADTLHAGEYRIELGLWPTGRLILTDLGRRFDTFSNALRQARNQARIAGMLAHAPSMPEVFEGALLHPGPADPVELQVYSTHITIVPAHADPWQVPLGALDDVVVSDNPPSVVLKSGATQVVIGQLARRRDAFQAAVSRQRNAQAQLLARYTNRSGFADGLGMPRDRISGFDAMLDRCCSADRLDGAKKVLAATAGGEPRLGFVQLLDPDDESLQAKSALPETWASFLLVPAGKCVVLEILAGPAAATYMFEGDVESVNRDLQQLHFRRAPLALTATQAEITPDNPYRLALRRLEPLKRLRAATRSRIVHSEGWETALAKSLSSSRH
jgi:hypothetical protein